MKSPFKTPFLLSPTRLKMLESDLFSARIDLDVKGLLRIAQFAGLISALAIILTIFLFDLILFPVADLFTDLQYAVLTIPLTIGVAASAAIGVYYAIISYPRIEMGTRKRAIDASMYEMVSYMYALHHCGATLFASIRSMAKYADYYGDAAKEFRQVVSDMDFCGYDQFTALQRLADTTPSTKMRYFISEFSSTYKSVGNAETFLHGKLIEMQEETRIAQKNYLSSLGTIAEMYITLFVAGPLFVVIVIMVLGMISGSDPAILAAVVYLMLPIGTAIFIILLDTISQGYIIERIRMPVSGILYYPEKEIVKAKVDETPLFAGLEKYDKRRKYQEFLHHPLAGLKENPELVFIFSIPLSVIIGIILYLNLVKIPFSPYLLYQWGSAVDDVIVISVLVAMVPYALLYGKKAAYARRVEAALPDFTRQLSSLVKHNMTVPRAIELTAQEGRSYIQEDIKALNRDLKWGEKLASALKRFADRMKNLSVDRLVILVSETEHFSNNMSTTLDLLYHESKNVESLKQERKSDMSVYVVIIYMSFVVFLFVEIVMSEVFLDIMIDNSDALSLSTSTGSSFPAQLYQLIIYHSVLIHGFCSGLVAGMMGSGSAKGGIKHSCIMLAMGAVVFIVASMFL